MPGPPDKSTPPRPSSGLRPGIPQVPDHEMLRRIGGGSYGEVWLARSVMGTYRAVKIVYRDSFENDRPFEREFNGIQKFEPMSRSHESQVDILHVGKGDGYFYYVMELADDAEQNPKSEIRNPNVEPGPAKPIQASDFGLLSDFDIRNSDLYTPRTLKTELFRRGKLPPDECLQISLALTTALQHLHKHGLVHRDVKPSNIIFVHGIPKLADIGLVTSTDATFSYVGTEGFIAPEGPGTPQADIYSLGKVLYEISTGRDRQEFPELPTNLAELPEREGILELNAIIAKACHHDPSARYQSASEMNADCVLLQSGKSVRRVRSLERRLARATRIGAAIGAFGVVLVLAFFYQQHQTREARRLVEENRRLALKNEQVAQVLKNILQSVGPSKALGRDTAMLREVLDKTVERFGKDLADQPEIEAELRDTIGSVYQELGQYDKAEAMARRTLALRRALAGDHRREIAISLGNLAAALRERGPLAEAESSVRQGLDLAKQVNPQSLEVAQLLKHLAGILREQGKLADAEAAFRQVLELREKLLGAKSAEVASSLNDLALTLFDQGKFPEAEVLYRRDLALKRQLLPKDDPELATTINNLAILILNRGRMAEAEALLREALDITRKVMPADHPDIARNLNSLGNIYLKQDRLMEAESAFGDVLNRLRKQPGTNEARVPIALNNLATTLWKQNKLADAEPLLREALVLHSRLSLSENPGAAVALHNLSNILRDQGNLCEAEKLKRQSLAVWRKISPEHSNITLALDDLVDLLLRQGRLDEADHLSTEYLTPATQNQPQYAGLLMVRANFLARRSRFKDAAALAAQAIELKPQDQGFKHTAMMLAAQDDPTAYGKICQSMLVRFTATNEPGPAARMALDCLLFPPCDTSIETLESLAKTAVTTGTNNYFFPQFHLTQGLLDYRRGRFASAADWSAKSLGSSGHRWDDRLHIEAYTVRALALWQLKQAAASRADLSKAAELADSKLPHGDSPDLGSDWRDWALAQALFREANSLIRGEFPANAGQ